MAVDDFWRLGLDLLRERRWQLGDSNADTASRMPLDLQIGPASMAVFSRNGGVGHRGRRLEVHPPLRRSRVCIYRKQADRNREAHWRIAPNGKQPGVRWAKEYTGQERHHQAEGKASLACC